MRSLPIGPARMSKLSLQIIYLCDCVAIDSTSLSIDIRIRKQ
jgi:hypothetical protein